MVRELCEQLLQECHHPLAGVGAAGTKPRLHDLFGLGAEGQQRMVGRRIAFVRVEALRRSFLVPEDGLDRGIGIDPFLVLRGDVRMSEVLRTRLNALTHRVDQRLHVADMAFADLLEQPSERALIRQALPIGRAAQDLIGPQCGTLAETACPADQAHHNQEGDIDELVDGVGRSCMLDMVTKQSVEAECVEKLDDQHQPRLATHGATAVFEANFRRRTPRHPGLFCATFDCSLRKGDSSG